ncbi:MAG: RNA methyltransferase [Chloroflexi bacterium]|nr:RNA methyltransferase [Chloroflexota bacterium]
MSNSWQSILTMIQRTATARGRAASGYFSIEGTRLHERALRANVPFTAVITTQTTLENPSSRETAVFHQLISQNIPLHPIPNNEMAKLTQGRRLGDLIGLVCLPKPPQLADWLAAHSAPMLLVAVDVVDPGNVGGMIRTAHALGAGLFIAVGGSDPFHPRAVRTSMGSLFRLPIVTTTLPRLFEDLRPFPIQTIGTVAESSLPLPLLKVNTGGTAVFMGSEYWGLSDELLNQLDQRVTIPMAPGIDSFSVNAAAAIVLYELQRQTDK